jgi:hypothetical protein
LAKIEEMIQPKGHMAGHHWDQTSIRQAEVRS